MPDDYSMPIPPDSGPESEWFPGDLPPEGGAEAIARSEIQPPNAPAADPTGAQDAVPMPLASEAAARADGPAPSADSGPEIELGPAATAYAAESPGDWEPATAGAAAAVAGDDDAAPKEAAPIRVP